LTAGVTCRVCLVTFNLSSSLVVKHIFLLHLPMQAWGHDPIRSFTCTCRVASRLLVAKLTTLKQTSTNYFTESLSQNTFLILQFSGALESAFKTQELIQLCSTLPENLSVYPIVRVTCLFFTLPPSIRIRCSRFQSRPSLLSPFSPPPSSSSLGSLSLVY
jgi:hypothetical protein